MQWTILSGHQDLTPNSDAACLRLDPLSCLAHPGRRSTPIPGSNNPSTAATRVHVIKRGRSEDMRERDKEAKNNGKKSKGKGKGKGKGKAKSGNHVGVGSTVRELSSSRHPTDPWDDLCNAWAAMESSV